MSERAVKVDWLKGDKGAECRGFRQRCSIAAMRHRFERRQLGQPLGAQTCKSHPPLFDLHIVHSGANGHSLRMLASDQEQM